MLLYLYFFFYPQMYEKETGKQNWIAGNGREGKKT